MQKSIEQLKQHFPKHGRVEWMGLRPETGSPMQSVSKVTATADHGLEGDKAGQRPGGKRQVTLIQFEYLSIIHSLLPNSEVTLAALRRNIAIAGINLNALKDRRIQIGAAELEVTGLCHPCRKLEQRLGYGVFNALRGHGGLTAKVMVGGNIALGDSVQVLA